MVGRQSFKWRRVECDLVDNGGVFIAKGQAVACDPQEAIIDDQPGEDHVGLCILYCRGTMLTVMIIWKWLLVQTIFDRYPLREHFIAFNETHILNEDDAKTVGVKKKILFIRGSGMMLILKVLFLELKKCC